MANTGGEEWQMKVENGKFKSNFVTQKSIGKGYFGEVFLVKSKADNNNYAIKKIELKKDLVEDEGDYKKNINREVSILQKCEHVSVVKYYESWREHGKSGSDLATIYIRMEHCPLDLYEFCGSIKSIYKRNTNEVICLVSYFIMLTMVEEILVALDYLHSKNIMHRDIKQWNILLKRDGNNWVKLSDFGLAKVEDAYSQTHTNVGTATYKAPEVKWGGHYTTSADVFSLGIMLIQFFDLDINKQDFHHELKDLFARMIAGKATERPTCKQSLADINKPPLVYDLDKVRADHHNISLLDQDEFLKSYYNNKMQLKSHN